MKNKRTSRLLKWILFAIGMCIITFLIYDRVCPAPVPMKQTLYEGVTYQRMVRVIPHPMIALVIMLDRKTADTGFLVTPPDRKKDDLPLDARTTCGVFS